jgi:F-type H+-transporting ATPase subunit b
MFTPVLAAASSDASMFSDPTFWVAIAFVLFALLAVWKILPMAGKSLDSYADDVRKELDEARVLREEAQNLLAEYKRKQSSAMDDASAIVEQARSSAEAMKENAEANLKTAMKRREEAGVLRIKQAESQAVQEVRHQTVDVAIAAMEQLLADKASGKVGTGLVDEAIKQLPSSIH